MMVSMLPLKPVIVPLIDAALEPTLGSAFGVPAYTFPIALICSDVASFPPMSIDPSLYKRNGAVDKAFDDAPVHTFPAVSMWNDTEGFVPMSTDPPLT